MDERAINKNFPFMEFPLSISRQGDFPIDRKSLWWDKAEADKYASSDPTAYIGMPISVHDEAAKTVTLYIVNQNKQLQQVGKPVKVDNLTLEKMSDGETLQIKGFSEVSKAGLVLRTKQLENGTFTIEWAETKDATVDSLVNRITAVEKELPNKAAKAHTHVATEVTEDEAHRFTTDAEKTTWNAKATPDDIKKAIDAIPVADNTKNGLMSAVMVQGHEALAQDMVTAKADIKDIKDNGNINYHIAAANTLGAVKIGANISVTAEGVISTHTPYVHPAKHEATIITEDATHRFVTDVEKASYADKYTKAEIDNLFNTLETATVWKPAVETFDKIAETYPKPIDGWTVNVNDTDITYRYTGIEWIAISANAIPKATSSVDGKMSKEDKAKLDGIATGANNYVHPANHPATMITTDNTHLFMTKDQQDSWTAGKATADAAKALADTNAGKISTAKADIEQIREDITLMTTTEAQAIIDKYKTKAQA